MPASSSFSYDVFLSHNSADKTQVRILANRLKDAGLRVWFDEWIIRAGDDIFLAIERGLEGARVQVLCLSPEALASDWVALERSTVLFRDPSNAGRRFIPLLLADCDLPDTLRRYKYVDYRDEAPAAFDDLLAACRADVKTKVKTKPGKTKIKPRNERLESAISRETGEPIAVLQCKQTGHADWVHSIAVSPDGTWAVSGSADGTIRIWDLETRDCRSTLLGHVYGEVYSVSITPDGKRILTGARDANVTIWNLDSGREVESLAGHANKVRSVVAFRDNRLALSTGFDNTLKIWNTLSLQCIKTIKTGLYSDVNNPEDVFTADVTPAGTHALSGHRDGRIRYWDLETGKVTATLNGHSDAVESIRITGDGRFAVSSSDDMTLKVWDLDAGMCIGTLEGHLAQVLSVDTSRDGTLIASAGFTDRTVRLWDLRSGACLQVIEPLQYFIPVSLRFSDDGSQLLVGTLDGQIHLYRVNGLRVAAQARPSHRYMNAKVVLLGEGAIGKTSLAYRLIEDKYVVTDRTHGMNVWRLDLPQAGKAEKRSRSKRMADDAPQVVREALLWDLAGQEDYRLIHRLFLDETALALLLVNPQKDDPFAEAGDWLRALETAAVNHESKREATRLLVFSQIDVGGMKLGQAKIDRFREEHGFVGWLPTSAKTGQNCSDKKNGGQPSRLKQLIADHIPWEKLPWTSTPRLLSELKNALLSMRDESDIRLLRFKELAQRLEQALPSERFGEAEARTAVTLLANHGLARPLKFGDLILLQPELLSGYAAAVIRAARAHTDEIGCVLEADIYREEFDFTGVDRLKHRPDEELLLRAMVQTFLDHSLCIAEETPQGRHLVFPTQYRREKDLPLEPDVFVSYSFRGEWQIIWTTLVVRLWYSQEFEHRELWRNAAEFATPKDDKLGLKIDNRQGEGEATISLYFDTTVPDELRVIFIEYVQQHLARYACDVTRDRRYVCRNCSMPVTDLEAVRKRFAAGRDFITCQGCDKHVPLIDFIEQRLKSDPVARKILAMEETATRELDTQALEQILIGHVQAITGEANQIFRELPKFDYGIDGEVEFKDNDNRASGKKIYVQLKSGNSFLRTRKRDGREIFDVKDDRHLEYWISQPVDVFLVIRQTDERTGEQSVRWMNVTRYLKNRTNKDSRQIVFDGENLTMEAVWRLRDEFFRPKNPTLTR